jgi:hypothetical protein
MVKNQWRIFYKTWIKSDKIKISKLFIQKLIKSLFLIKISLNIYNKYNKKKFWSIKAHISLDKNSFVSCI